MNGARDGAQSRIVYRSADGSYTDAFTGKPWPSASAEKPAMHVIDTLDELDALPIGAVVRTANARVAVKQDHPVIQGRRQHRSYWYEAEYDSTGCGTDDLRLPALLLWQPPDAPASNA